MSKREELRNLETIPVGSLGIISLEGCKSLGENNWTMFPSSAKISYVVLPVLDHLN